MKFLKGFGHTMRRIAAFIAQPSFQDMERKAMSLVQLIQFMAPSKSLDEVVRVYQHFGLPVTEAMVDGKLTPDEIKALLGLGASAILKQWFPGVSTTNANLVLNAVYSDIK